MEIKKQLVFLCGARDFHAMDWYASAKECLRDKEVIILTDLIAGEGFEKIITPKDKVVKLLILDKFLFRGQSSLGNLWRNLLKFLVLPIQVLLIKKFYNKHPNSFFHAHSMYYLWMAWLAKVPFIGTPQGSDILIKPNRSKIFKWLSKKSMCAAFAVIVDSEKMSNGVYDISGLVAHIIQNGIDIKKIESFFEENMDQKRERILSIRGFTELYRIKEILKARDNSAPERIITFIYPFFEKNYLNGTLFKKFDDNLGRVSKLEYYRVLSETQLMISIPSSDSSPRSVYEAIFCGAVVAITYHPYYDSLPKCMKERIIIIDLNDNNWLIEALSISETKVKEKFIPSEIALDLFDQRRSFKKVYNLFPN